MSDELTISAVGAGGGTGAAGTSTVAVDELFVDAARLGAAACVIDGWIRSVVVIGRDLGSLPLPAGTGMWESGSPTIALEHAERELRRARELAESLQAGLGAAAERYGATERFIDGLWRLGASIGAHWLGGAAPALLAGGVLAAAANAAAAALWRGAGLGATPLERWLGEHRGMLSDPAFVRLVRLAADHADEFTAGALHVPLPSPVVATLGSGVGAPESASVLLGLAGGAGLLGSRLLVEGPVRVERAATRAVDAPNGVGDLAERVPSNGADGAQIRIERYGGVDDPRWIVYVSGTVDAGLVGDRQPFDMTSNVHGVAARSGLDALQLAGGGSGAGERAVREAMHAAGVQPGDPVLPVGYSGGGIVAANLAADPGLNVVGAVNLGGPVASACSRDGVSVLSVEHDEDLVPASGGAGQPSPDRLTVSRSVLAPGREYEGVLPAHELSAYRETAALIDESEEARLAAFRSLVAEITGGGAGQRSEWVATRVVSPEPTGAR